MEENPFTSDALWPPGLLQKPVWLTIGVFDGMHRGHQALIAAMVEAAHGSNGLAAVVTFYPHPAVVLRQIPMPYYLMIPEEKTRLMDACGVDAVISLPFSKRVAEMSAETFLNGLLKRMCLHTLWVGDRFALGRDREGSIQHLRELGQHMGFHIHTMPNLAIQRETVSSTLIRRALLAGEVEQAAAGLGRPYEMSGRVVHGDGRGRKLGFPTANLETWREQIVPARGVYACQVWIDGKRWPAVTNIGVRPTVTQEGSPATIEAHVLGKPGDLYGQQVRLEFIRRLRAEQRFTSLDELIKQIKLDILQAREVLDE